MWACLGHPGTVDGNPGQSLVILQGVRTRDHLPECFIIVVIGRTDTCYHDGLGVASQRRLEQSRQFRVPVWNMCGATIHQGCGSDVMMIS